MKRLGALSSLKHVSFDINHLYVKTRHSTLNAIQLKNVQTKHVKIISTSLPIYSTLQFTYVIEYDRRPHSDTQTEWNIHEVTKCKPLQYVK
jgi:ABC-type transport system involved in Fe-S cluster assembly fused permease/ATPase subunit